MSTPQQRYEERNKEKRRQVHRDRYLRNRERHLMLGKEWASKNKVKINQNRKKWRQIDPERFRKKVRDSYWKHVEKRRLASRKYSRLKSLRRRARLKAARFDETGIKEWMQKVRSQRRATCYHCAKVVKIEEIEFDHVVPISKGGAHALDNLCVSCFDCNRSKHSKKIGEWIRKGQQILSL